VLVYPVGLSVSTRSLRFVTDALRAHRRAGRTRWRLLSSHRQALMVLAHLRKGETYRDLAVGFGVGTTTAYRYLREALKVLATLAPTLAQAMTIAARKAYVTLDGTLLAHRPGPDDLQARLSLFLGQAQGPRGERTDQPTRPVG
jgi:Helix-turn-helix of DDE superfamily endonuclease